MNSRKVFLFRFVLTIGYLQAFYKIFTVALDKRYAKDFLQDYLLAAAWRTGINPYQNIDTLTDLILPGARDHYGYFFPHPTPHPPTMAVLFYPLSLLSYETASLVFLGMEIASVALSFALLSKVIGDRVPAEMKQLLGLLFLSSYPVGQEFLQGNINLLQLCMFCVLITSYERYPLIAGSCLGYTIALKLGGVLLLPYLLVKRQWSVLLACGLFCATALLLFLSRSGWDVIEHYLLVALPEVTKLYSGFYANLSLWTLPGKLVFGVLPIPFFSSIVAPALLPYPALLPVLKLLLIGGAFIGAYAAALRSKDTSIGIAILLAASVVLTPSSWHHVPILLAIPLAILLRETARGSVAPRSFILPGLLAFGAAYGIALSWFVLILPDSLFLGRAQLAVITQVDAFRLFLVSLFPTLLVAGLIAALYRRGAE